MTTTNIGVDSVVTRESTQAVFLAMLPKIEQVARFHFRHCRCGDRKQDCISETVAVCWLWHRRLVAQGRDPSAFVATLTRLAALAVSSGRRLCGQQSARDALSPVCHRRQGFAVAPLPDPGSDRISVFDDALRDNMQSPIPDQVQFRVDYPSWRATLDDRCRRLVDAMMEGRSTSELATRFGVTPGRVAQLRREFHDGYVAFCGDGSG
jgi:DNA-directed RNA polymerase specialized sigma24 family protein